MALTAIQKQINKATGVNRQKKTGTSTKNLKNAMRRKSRGGWRRLRDV